MADGADQVEIEARGHEPRRVGAARKLIEGSSLSRSRPQVLRLRVANEDCLPEVVRCLVESGARSYSVVPQRVSLEDLFLEMMGPDPGL